MAETAKGEIVALSEPMTATFLNVFNTEKYQGKDTDRYAVTLVFDPAHPDFEAIKSAAVKAARSKWPNRDIGAAFKAGELKMPWKDGDHEIQKRNARREKRGEPLDSKLDYLKGTRTIKPTSYQPPRLAVLVNGKPVDLDGPGGQVTRRYQDKFYPGVKVLAELYFIAKDAQSEDKTDGVICYLNLLMSTGTGDRMGGGRSAGDAFSKYIGRVSKESVSGGDPDGLGDEIPF